jgi:hypothetical protein
MKKPILLLVTVIICFCIFNCKKNSPTSIIDTDTTHTDSTDTNTVMVTDIIFQSERATILQYSNIYWEDFYSSGRDIDTSIVEIEYLTGYEFQNFFKKFFVHDHQVTFTMFDSPDRNSICNGFINVNEQDSTIYFHLVYKENIDLNWGMSHQISVQYLEFQLYNIPYYCSDDTMYCTMSGDEIMNNMANFTMYDQGSCWGDQYSSWIIECWEVIEYLSDFKIAIIFQECTF